MEIEGTPTNNNTNNNPNDNNTNNNYQNKKIEYMQGLGQVIRFRCPTDKENNNKNNHSQYINSYEMYKYHIKYCRELRNIQEVFICKFCVRLFLENKKRDIHQSKCPCRLVSDNIIFDMPNHLKQKYPLNKINFDNQDDIFTIVDAFPVNEPISINVLDQKNNFNNNQGNYDGDLNNNIDDNFDENDDEEEEEFDDDHYEDDSSQKRNSSYKNKSCCGQSASKNNSNKNEYSEKDNLKEIKKQEEIIIDDDNDNDIQQNNTMNDSVIMIDIIRKSINLLSVQEELLNVQDNSQKMLNENNYTNNEVVQIDQSQQIITDEKNNNNDNDGNDQFKQPSRKKYTSRNFKKIIVKSNHENVKKDSQNSFSQNKRQQNELVIEDEINNNNDIKIIESNKGLIKQQNDNLVEKNNNIIILDTSINEDENNNNNQIQQEKQTNETNQPKSITTTLNSNKEIQDNILQNQKYYTPMKRQYIRIKIIDFLDIQRLNLQEDEIINSEQYNEINFTNISFQKQSRYCIKNISELNSLQHLIATFQIQNQEDIQYIQNNFFISTNNNNTNINSNININQQEQFCLISIGQQKLAEFFLNKPPYTCLFQNNNNDSNQWDQQYPTLNPYSIYIITLDNPYILDPNHSNSINHISNYNINNNMDNQNINPNILQNETNKEQHNNNDRQQPNKSIKMNLFLYEGFQVWKNDIQTHMIYLTNKISKELLEKTANELKIWNTIVSQSEKIQQQFCNDLEKLTKEKEEKSKQLADIKERISNQQKLTFTKSKKRINKLKNFEQSIILKKKEYQNNISLYNTIQQDINELRIQVNQYQQSLLQEIEKAFQSAKDKSDQVYQQQVEKHKADVIALAQENISDKFALLEQLKNEHKILINQQYESMDTQRKSGQILLKYSSKIEDLISIKRNKQKVIQLQKNKQQTAHLCLSCKKYPQSCLQKPCGHIVCCYTCLNQENEDKGIIYCKICKIEVIKFSEIKYKIQF